MSGRCASALDEIAIYGCFSAEMKINLFKIDEPGNGCEFVALLDRYEESLFIRKIGKMFSAGFVAACEWILLLEDQ